MSALPPASRLRSISVRERVTFDPALFQRFAGDATDLDEAMREYVHRLVLASEAFGARAIVSARRSGR